MYIYKLHNLLQNLHPKIKFPMEHSFKELPFLDISIKNKNSQIITDIYHKPTDTLQYLHFNRHHPKNLIKSISYTIAHRVCTIITNKTLRETHLKELNPTLLQSGYPTTLINMGFKLAEKISQKEPWNPQKYNNEKSLAYVPTYNKNNPELFQEIKKI